MYFAVWPNIQIIGKQQAVRAPAAMVTQFDEVCTAKAAKQNPSGSNISVGILLSVQLALMSFFIRSGYLNLAPFRQAAITFNQKAI